MSTTTGLVRSSPLSLHHRAAGRTAGSIDTADLVIGIVLLILVPLMVVAVGSMFKGPDEPDPSASSNAPKTDVVVPDEELIRLRWESAERAYERNAKVILGKAEAAEDDDHVRSTLRHMAAVSLQSALSELTQLEVEVARYPQQFGHYSQRIVSMKRDVEADLRKAR